MNSFSILVDNFTFSENLKFFLEIAMKTGLEGSTKLWDPPQYASLISMILSKINH